MAKIFSVVCLAALCVVAKAGIYGGGYGGGGYGGGGHGGLGYGGGDGGIGSHHEYQHLGTFVGKHHVPPKEIRITKTVAVKVPVPYPVKVPHTVPYPVHVVKHVPVPVPKIIKIHEQVPVAIPKSAPAAYKHDEQAQQSEHIPQPSAHGQQAHYDYYKESGKYTSPVFDISAFHPTVLNKGPNYEALSQSYHSVGNQQAQQSYGGGDEAVSHEAIGHEAVQAHFGGGEGQEGGHSNLHNEFQAIQGQGYTQTQDAHQQQGGIPQYHFEQASAGGNEGKQEASGEHYQQDQGQQYGQAQQYEQTQQHYGQGQQAHGGFEEENAAAYAAVVQQAQKANAYSYTPSQGGQQEHGQSQIHYQPEIQQHQQAQYEAPQSSYKLPATHTYSYFKLGGGSSLGHDSSSRGLGHQLQYQAQKQQLHAPAQEYIQHAPQQGYSAPAEKAHDFGGFQQNIGHSVLKEVQGPQFGGHGQGISGHAIYAAPSVASGHGHYKNH